jgi:hypothetical protein
MWADPTAIVQISDVHNLRTFFVGIRTRWVLENHGRTQIGVQTLRDMLSVTTAIASAAMAFISIFIGLSKTNLAPSASFLTCDPADGANPCNTYEERLKLVRYVNPGFCSCKNRLSRAYMCSDVSLPLSRPPGGGGMRAHRFALVIANFVVIFFNCLLGKFGGFRCTFICFVCCAFGLSDLYTNEPIKHFSLINQSIHQSIHQSTNPSATRYALNTSFMLNTKSEYDHPFMCTLGALETFRLAFARRTNTHARTHAHAHSGGREAALADADGARACSCLLPLHAGRARVSSRTLGASQLTTPRP